MEKFEDLLSQMTKPEVTGLKHEDLLKAAILKAKDKSVISLWWLSIPLYVIAAFVMKIFFIPHSSFISMFHELTDRKGYTAVSLFLVLPLMLVIINLISIRQLFYLYGNSKTIKFIKIVFTPILIIILSLLVLIMYFL